MNILNTDRLLLNAPGGSFFFDDQLICCEGMSIFGFAGIMSSTLLSIGKSPVLQESRLAGKFCIDGGFQVCCLSINIHGVSEIIKKYGSDVIEITGTLRNLYTHVFRAVSVET